MKPQPFLIERYFAKHEFSAPYLLCASDCESMTIAELLALDPGAAEQFAAVWLGYPESLGDPRLRRAIASRYDRIGPDQVLVHAGAEEAIFNFMHIAVTPGDQLIVQTPYYQSLGEVARSIGAEVSEWRGDPTHGWQLDLEELKRLLTPRTRVVVVNFPHNPTGFLPSREFVTELAQLAEQHGFILFSDEVYRGLELDPADRLPCLADINHRAVSLGVMSKAFGLAGLRIGWIATQNASIFWELAAFKDYTSICNSAPSEFLATLALAKAEEIINRNLEIIRNNLDQLDTFFHAHAELFRWHRPKAGPIAFPSLLQGNTEQFCADLVDKAGVLLLPGTLYGKAFNSFRVGFGRQNLPESLQRFEDYLKKTK